MLPYGESVSIKKSVLRKRIRAIRGFVLPTQLRKRRSLRRLPRDTMNRKRRSRRGRLSGRRKGQRRTRHWSERRLRRLRKNAHSYRRFIVAKTFSRKLRGRFDSRFTRGRLHRKAAVKLPNFLAHNAGATLYARPRSLAIQPTSLSLDATSYLHERDRV